MKIGIDARPLQAETRFRGIGKSMENMLRALATVKIPASTKLVFFLDSNLDKPEVLALFPTATFRTIKSSGLRRGKYPQVFFTAFRAISPRRGSVDVLLQYDAALGVPTTVPTLVIFYDIIPLLFIDEERKNEDFSSVLRKYKRELGRRANWSKYKRMLASYKKATKIAAISECSRRDLLQHRQEIKPAKTSVIYLGVSQDASHEEPSNTAKKLATSPYLLYVGGIDTRKNIVSLLQTYIELKKDYEDLRLITVGKEFDLTRQLSVIGWTKLLKQNPAAAKDVIVPGFLSDADLHYLYGQATAFVFPSRYEGFGLPVIEAMKFGCPVVAYDNSSIPEVAGDAALLVSDGDDLAPAVRQLLDDSELRNSLAKKGIVQARKFTWEQTAAETLAALEELAMGKRGKA